MNLKQLIKINESYDPELLEIHKKNLCIRSENKTFVLYKLDGRQITNKLPNSNDVRSLMNAGVEFFRNYVSMLNPAGGAFEYTSDFNYIQEKIRCLYHAPCKQTQKVR